MGISIWLKSQGHNNLNKGLLRLKIPIIQILCQIPLIVKIHDLTEKGFSSDRADLPERSLALKLKIKHVCIVQIYLSCSNYGRFYSSFSILGMYELFMDI